MAGGEGGASAAVRHVRWTSDQSKLLSEWGHRAAAAQHAHYVLAARLRRSNLWLGIPTVVISAVVGTSLFATLAQEGADIPNALRAIVGTLSVLAAILAALQTFLRFAERSERHVVAGDWYAAIARRIDELAVMPPEQRGDPREVLDGIRKELNKASQSYPEIGEKLWHTMGKAYGVAQPPIGDETRVTVP
ncbi:MAG TPA: SLATT domain-containing protein [Actinomycetota bacterium]|nr:SLATT domain-containing protein [Actinomycetota bacterium]